jgi:hypothetical protein
MYKSAIKTLLFLTAITFTACGGGGGDDAAPSSSTTTSSTTVLAATSSNTTLEETLADSKISGVVINSSGVEGLTLKCGSTTTTSTLNGAFKCRTFPLEVFVGEYKLGEVAQLPADKIVYTQDLMNIPRGATTHPEVTKISMILQSLDEDATPLNGITLSNENLALLSSQLRVDSVLSEISLEEITQMLESIVDDAKLQNLESKLNVVDAQTAQLNLTTMTAQTPAPTYEQRSIGRI